MHSVHSLAIIGSSNLSAGAFDNRSKNWNQECDVIFWDENDSTAKILMKKLLEKEKGHSDKFFIANYDEESDFNTEPINVKLKNIELMIRKSSDLYPIS